MLSQDVHDLDIPVSSIISRVLMKFFRLLCLFTLIVTPTISKVQRGIIFGSGRIGSHLFESNGKVDFLLTKHDPFPTLIEAESVPIYVCTRNDDLNNVVEKVPFHRRNDLVFLQNGVLSTFLKANGLQDASQALIYYGIAKKNDVPIDGKTELNPEGLTSVTGKWAEDFSERMKQAGLSCKILEREKFSQAMLEKHVWICAFMAIGVKYGVNVGAVEMDHREEVTQLIRELARTGSPELGITLEPGFEARLCAYAKSVASFPTALKELKWRNGWFLDISERSVNQGKSDPAPLHSVLMKSLLQK